MNNISIYSRTREQLQSELAQAIANFRSRKQEEASPDDDLTGENRDDRNGGQSEINLPE